MTQVHGGRVNSSRSSQSMELGQATLRAGNLLAITFLFFGIAIAVLVPATLEQRIGSSILLGLMPAVCFHIGGHLLGRLLAVAIGLLEVMATRCFRGLQPPLKKLIVGLRSIFGAADRYISVFIWLFASRLHYFRRVMFCSVRRLSWHLSEVILAFSCLLVRSTARSVIRIQDLWAATRTH
jgi:hypothetical protein